MSSIKLLGLGNPLLDIQTPWNEPAVGEAWFKRYQSKYNIEQNGAYLVTALNADYATRKEKLSPAEAHALDDAGEDLDGIYDGLKALGEKVSYVAGGSAQNAIRGAAYVLGPNVTAYCGCVGNDDSAAKLKAENEKAGVKSVYMVNSGGKTGSCAVLLTKSAKGEPVRCLLTDLQAAETFNLDHLKTPEINSILDSITHIYIEGFFLTHGVESATYVAKKASEAGKTVILNLSAAFLCMFFKEQIALVLPYVSIIIGNEDEGTAFAKAFLPPSSPFKELEASLPTLSSTATSKPVTIVVTQGSDPTLVVEANQSELQKYPVLKIAPEDIVDTNGAGDAFAGGLVGALVAGKSLKHAITVAQRMGRMNLGQIGPTYKSERDPTILDV